MNTSKEITKDQLEEAIRYTANNSYELEFAQYTIKYLKRESDIYPTAYTSPKSQLDRMKDGTSLFVMSDDEKNKYEKHFSQVYKSFGSKFESMINDLRKTWGQDAPKKLIPNWSDDNLETQNQALIEHLFDQFIKRVYQECKAKN